MLSSSIKKGEIERAFPSHYVLMLDDNTNLLLIASLSISGQFYSLKIYMIRRISYESVQCRPVEIQKKQGGSTAQLKAVVPLQVVPPPILPLDNLRNAPIIIFYGVECLLGTIFQDRKSVV